MKLIEAASQAFKVRASLKTIKRDKWEEKVRIKKSTIKIEW